MRLLTFVFIYLSAVLVPGASAQIVVEFEPAYNQLQPWTVPAGCTSLMVEAWGAGGHCGLGHIGGGRGGGGGAYAALLDLAVTPGEVLLVHVGQLAGGSSFVQRAGGEYLLIARGGGDGRIDGAGGHPLLGDPIADVAHSGGNGGPGNPARGGGGGGSCASSTGPGVDGSPADRNKGGSGGISTGNGGDGGDGGRVKQAGFGGTAPGGGRGGNGEGSYLGQFGAPGLVRITYQEP